MFSDKVCNGEMRSLQVDSAAGRHAVTARNSHCHIHTCGMRTSPSLSQKCGPQQHGFKFGRLRHVRSTAGVSLPRQKVWDRWPVEAGDRVGLVHLTGAVYNMSTGLALCIAGKSIFLYRASPVETGLALWKYYTAPVGYAHRHRASPVYRLLLSHTAAISIDSFLVIPRRSVMSRRLTRHLLDRPVDSRKKWFQTKK